MKKKKKIGFTTKILHNNQEYKIENGSIHKPIYNNVAFKYKYAQNLIDVFQNKKFGYKYSRQNNPTINSLEEKITKMENGISTICFSSGMSAISSTIYALIRKKDNILSSKFLFGNTNSMWKTMKKQGIKINLIDMTNIKNIKNKIDKNTRIIFVETIANPRTQIVDLESIGKLCIKNNILYIVDNTITSPYIFNPKKIGASLVINSLTKSINGHGNVLGGSLTDTGLYNWKLFPNICNKYKKNNSKLWGIIQIRCKGLRDLGGALSPESANYISLGSDTLALRQKKECFNALALANMLKNNKNVFKVYYPGLITHPQHLIAKKLFKYYGNLLSFELNKNINFLNYLNNLKIAILASNLADNRTLVIPIAQTIYHEMGRKNRNNMGISNSLIRVSVGIENTKDLLYDFYQAFNKK